jgi:lipopolysaccharide export system protein LptA
MAADGGRTRVEGESLFFLFDKDKELNVMAIQRGARLAGSDPGDPVERRLEGERVSYDGLTRAIKSFGSPAGPSRSRSADEEVAADWIFVFTQNNNVNASGSVTVVLRPKPAGEAGVEGFFQPGRAVFVRAGLLTREDVARRFSLYQGFRMWQDKQVLEGRDLGLDERSQEMEVHEGVRMSFVQAPKAGDPEERVEVSGDYMRYDPPSLQTVFTGKGGLKVRDIDLRAPILIVVPEPETGKPRKILSAGGVFIKWGLREVTCRNSDYDISQGSITLTGNPVVTEKDKSTIRGDKLTIHLADGNIQVENRDQQRSDVIIKS